MRGRGGRVLVRAGYIYRPNNLADTFLLGVPDLMLPEANYCPACCSEFSVNAPIPSPVGLDFVNPEGAILFQGCFESGSPSVSVPKVAVAKYRYSQRNDGKIRCSENGVLFPVPNPGFPKRPAKSALDF